MTVGQRVVIIDDDRLNNLICKKLIEIVSGDIAPTVVDFTSPELGLHYISDSCSTMNGNHVTLLLDLNMPNMSGWDFLVEFEKLDEHCKAAFTVFIVSSSHDPIDHRRAALNPNVKDFIVKPLTKDVVRRLLY